MSSAASATTVLSNWLICHLKKEIKKEIQRKTVPIPKRWVSKKAQPAYRSVQSPISSKPLTQNYTKTIQRDQTAPQCEDAPATGSEEN